MANFIVRFNSESLHYNVAPACEQWETGQSMEIAGFSAPITVSFACDGTAKTVSGTPKNIPIPDALLEIGKDIVATFDANGITYTIKIPVIRQEKPPVETPAAPTLPIVSDADDGKLLGVQGGKWNVVEGGSGSGGVFVVNLTRGEYDEQTETYPWTSDKTGKEIYEAFSSGLLPIAFFYTAPGERGNPSRLDLSFCEHYTFEGGESFEAEFYGTMTSYNDSDLTATFVSAGIFTETGESPSEYTEADWYSATFENVINQ